MGEEVYSVHCPHFRTGYGRFQEEGGRGEDATLFTASQFILSLDSLAFMSHDTMRHIVQTMLYLSDLS